MDNATTTPPSPLHQFELDFSNKPQKLPFSEVPRRGKYLNQKALQVEGAFKQCDAHPIYEGLFYWSLMSNGTQKWYIEDLWKSQGRPTPTEIHAKRKSAREYNRTKPDNEPPVYEDGLYVGKIDQKGLQVPWKPTYGDVHPRFPNYCFFQLRSDKVQRWVALESLTLASTRSKAYKKTPKGRTMSAKSRQKYVEKNPDKESNFLYQVAHNEYLEGLITKEERNKAYKLAAYQADLNDGKTHGDKFNIDHIIPRSHGGLSEPNNLQMVPAKWNFSKNNHNRSVMSHNGADCDIWYRTPYVYPRTREWTHSLSVEDIASLTPLRSRRRRNPKAA